MCASHKSALCDCVSNGKSTLYQRTCQIWIHISQVIPVKANLVFPPILLMAVLTWKVQWLEMWPFQIFSKTEKRKTSLISQMRNYLKLSICEIRHFEWSKICKAVALGRWKVTKIRWVLRQMLEHLSFLCVCHWPQLLSWACLHLQARHERDQVEEQRRQLQVELDELQEQLHKQQGMIAFKSLWNILNVSWNRYEMPKEYLKMSAICFVISKSRIEIRSFMLISTGTNLLFLHGKGPPNFPNF